MCEVAGLVAYSFGEEDVDRHTVVWKKEAAPAEEELACLRQDTLIKDFMASDQNGDMSKNCITHTG